MIPWAPASRTRLIIQSWSAAIRTIGETLLVSINGCFLKIELRLTQHWQLRLPCGTSHRLLCYHAPCQLRSTGNLSVNPFHHESNYVIWPMLEIRETHTSIPKLATVLAREYPGNPNHCPRDGGPPFLAISSEVRNWVAPVSLILEAMFWSSNDKISAGWLNYVFELACVKWNTEPPLMHDDH